MTSKSMMLSSSLSYDEKPTFQLIPVDANCPYLEAIYVPEKKALVVISKERRNSFHMLPKLDETGMPMVVGKSRPNEFRQQRVSVETFYEYYIRTTGEIKSFVDMFAINSDTFDYDMYLVKDMVEAPAE